MFCVQLAEECSAMVSVENVIYRRSDAKVRLMKECDDRLDKIAFCESHWRHIDDVGTRVRTKKIGTLIYISRDFLHDCIFFFFFLY